MRSFARLVDSCRSRHAGVQVLLGHGWREPGLRGHGQGSDRSDALTRRPINLPPYFETDGRTRSVASCVSNPAEISLQQRIRCSAMTGTQRAVSREAGPETLTAATTPRAVSKMGAP